MISYAYKWMCIDIKFSSVEENILKLQPLSAVQRVMKNIRKRRERGGKREREGEREGESIN